MRISDWSSDVCSSDLLSARDAYGETVKMLRDTLENSGVKVYNGAPYKLVLTSEQQSQRSLSYAGAGRSAEYELNNVLSYEIRGQNNLLLLADKLQVQTVYHDSEDRRVGKECGSKCRT